MLKGCRIKLYIVLAKIFFLNVLYAFNLNARTMGLICKFNTAIFFSKERISFINHLGTRALLVLTLAEMLEGPASIV